MQYKPSPKCVSDLLKALAPYVEKHQHGELTLRPMYINGKLLGMQVEVVHPDMPDTTAPLIQLPLPDALRGQYDRNSGGFQRAIYALVFLVVLGAVVGVASAIGVVFFRATMHFLAV